MKDLWALPRLWGRCGAHCQALARPTVDPVSRELRDRRRHAAGDGGISSRVSVARSIAADSAQSSV
jgi:hypothetical protein